jgi:hypothetical protein
LDGRAFLNRASNRPEEDDRPEEMIQGCFNSTVRGYTMPAFSFEKISPPHPPAAKKQRGVIVQVIDRFVGVRVKRATVEEQAVVAHEENPSD